ncbi:hypothetical protein [Curtobacterium sp. ME26]|uniref:hypothetical protein n=1 Tax=Curtobacterium sp. ME26 TaxID=2744254 RepID=UPI0015F4CBF5|nr:hypothetical protein [Curtobacterium sp. ME26]
MRALRSVGSRAAAALVVAVLAATLAWYRLGPVARGTAWAEDAGVFLRERLQYGFEGTLLRPYAGYLHVVPRLVVDVAVSRPVEQYALTVSALSCAAVGLVAAGVFVLAREVVPAWPLRLVLAAVPVVVPVVPYEVSGNAANLHWFALVVAPWLFAHRARSWWSAAVVAVAAAAVVLTEPQALLFTPLLVLAWWRAPGSPGWSVLRALPVTVATVAAGAAQVLTATTSVRESRPGGPAVADVVVGYLLQPVAGSWDRRLGVVGHAVVAHGWVVLVAPTVALVLVGTAAVLVGSWRARALVVALGLGSVVVWAASLVANASADGHWAALDVAGLQGQTPTRYAAASAVLLVSSAVLAAAVLVQRTGGAGRLVGAAVGWCVVTAVVAAAVANVAPAASVRAGGPEWEPQVSARIGLCRAEPDLVLDVRAQPWGAAVPCWLVLSGRGSSGTPGR